MFPASLFLFSFLILSSIYLGFVIPVDEVSFNFPIIGTNTSGFLHFENSSYVNSQGIQVTPFDQNTALTDRVGRATYYQPFHLWDVVTGEEASFNTHFTFVINSLGQKAYGDGLAFFLVPNGSTIPTDSHGGTLGLTPYNNPTNSTRPFVAVEFDTFYNYNFDTINNTHVGIDVKSMKSLADVIWWSGVQTGNMTDAWISYDSKSKTLNVNFTNFFPNGTVGNGSVSYPLNLTDLLPEWVTFGFSASTGGLFEQNTIKSWDFSSSALASINNNTPTPSPTPNSNSNPTPTPTPTKKGLIIGILIGICTGGIIAVLIICFLCRRKKKKKKIIIQTNREHLNEQIRMQNQYQDSSSAAINSVSLCFNSFPYEPNKIPYNVLVQATNKFSDKLGSGGFGGVYRGTLTSPSSSRSIAVKRMTGLDERKKRAYLSEVKIISRLNHTNVIELIGWCHEVRDELLLVYEFMPNGSLDGYLFNTENKFLEWSVRYNKIVMGLTSAMQHMLEDQEQCVLHRDIKSSNILLDMEFNVKLGDFGLARLIPYIDKESLTTRGAGTPGYMAPEFVYNHKPSKKSEIYSFGIVLLEIACGRKAVIKLDSSNYVNLSTYIWEIYQSSLGDANPMEVLLRAADPRLQGQFNQPEMLRLLMLGVWCTHLDPKSRPLVSLVKTLLNVDEDIPEIPPPPPNIPPWRLQSPNTSLYVSASRNLNSE